MTLSSLLGVLMLKWKKKKGIRQSMLLAMNMHKSSTHSHKETHNNNIILNIIDPKKVYPKVPTMFNKLETKRNNQKLA